MTTLSPTTRQATFVDNSVGQFEYATDGAGNFWPVHVAVDGTGAIITPAQDGTDGAGATQATGGTGMRGWFASLVKFFQPLSMVSSSSVGSALTLKSGAGSLASINMTIGTTPGYLMIFDALSAPADGAVTPVMCFPVTTDGTRGGYEREFKRAWNFTTGCTVVFSTTGSTTKTASGTAFFFGQVQ